MKTFSFFILIGLISMITPLVGQSEIREVKILTNMHCMNCKKKIENELGYTKGVVEAVADLETRVVTVKYNSQQISPEKLVETVQKLGYQATVLNQSNQAIPVESSTTGKENCEKKSSCCKKKQEACKE